MKKIIAVLISLLFVASTFGIASVLGKSGGPDNFGYTYDDGVQYQWIDISGTGKTHTSLKNDDDIVAVPIGFDFMFYGNTYDEVGISTNGLLEFKGLDSTWINRDIPSTSPPHNIICVFWDDLYPPSAGTVYYQSFPDKFIVQWDGIPHYGDRSSSPYSSMTFQVILYRKSNTIKFQYKEMKNLSCLFADGRSATIGIENIDGTDGLKYYYGNAPCTGIPAGPIKDGLAIEFKCLGEKTLPIDQILKILKANKDKE